MARYRIIVTHDGFHWRPLSTGVTYRWRWYAEWKSKGLNQQASYDSFDVEEVPQ